MERLSSGRGRLDTVLAGGLPVNAINLIIGAPGTGKTILADQYVFENATEQRPAIYYSTISEPYDKLLRYGQTLDFFDATAIGRSVFYEALAPALLEGGLPAVLQRVAEDIKRRRPGVIVIDSFRALAAYDTAQAFRTFLSELADLLTAFPVSAFWIGEYVADDIAVAPEFAVADSILVLSREATGLRETSYLQVLKLRGSAFLSGKHACRISADGVDVFPRLADPGSLVDIAPPTARTSSGIAALDDLLHGGFIGGSSSLVGGPSGGGKTLLGLHFILDGSRHDEPGVIASFQENPSQLRAIARGFGWDLTAPKIDHFYQSAVDLYVDEWIYGLLDRIDRIGAKRVLVDSIGDIEFATADPTRFREFIYSFIQRAARAGISVMFSMEVPELFGVVRLPERGFSDLVDNVVLLQYVRSDSALTRALTVVKSRGTAHDPRVHAFDITDTGIVLGGEVALTEGDLEPR